MRYSGRSIGGDISHHITSYHAIPSYHIPSQHPTTSPPIIPSHYPITSHHIPSSHHILSHHPIPSPPIIPSHHIPSSHYIPPHYPIPSHPPIRSPLTWVSISTAFGALISSISRYTGSLSKEWSCSESRRRTTKGMVRSPSSTVYSPT